MVTKKIATRDYLRAFITKANKEAGVTYNASKLNSKEECEEYLLNLIKNLRHKKQDNKAYVKEIESLKEEIEILNTGNKRLESEKMFYITQAKEAGKIKKDDEEEIEYFKNRTRFWHKSYREETEKNNVIKKFNTFLSFVIVLEALSIAMLIWK
ncbi:hypothetical protein HMPREF0946_01099 [Fusobacterium vincentii 3_1_36A2]|uniref:Uncharacterized protein n=1 Tax=Fusobacterium vincentii 3_1_36A2 TaxID=469604 RepID=C7XQD3_FUSVC|nr:MULTISPECIES: hypothetical protein [Fusobacterium]EEU33026.2 hypothetical protein HMPREF0946_01099 [Fusobacterium vincentii 3_1_36A2]